MKILIKYTEFSGMLIEYWLQEEIISELIIYIPLFKNLVFIVCECI